MTTRHAACKYLFRSSHLVPWALTAGLATDCSIAKHPGQLNAPQGWVLGSQIARGDLESEKPASGAWLLWLPGHPLPPAVLSLSSIPTAPQEAAPRPTRPISMVTAAITCNPPQEVSEEVWGACVLLCNGHSQIPAAPEDLTSPEIRALKKNMGRCS